MERHEVLAMMTALKLAGMRAAYDDILADGLKRRHPVQQIIGTLLQTEVADKQARSIKYQMTSARLPTAKELADFDFAASPGNEPLIQELAGDGFLEGTPQRVLPRHLSDQIADFPRHGRSAWLSPPRLPCPEKPEPLAVPTDDGLRPDNYQGVAPARP